MEISKVGQWWIDLNAKVDTKIDQSHRFELRTAYGTDGKHQKCLDAGAHDKGCDWDNGWRLFSIKVKDNKST